MAGSIARQPWRLGAILLLLAVAVTALLIAQALAPDSAQQNGSQIIESGGAPQISDIATTRPPAPAAATETPAGTPGAGIYEPVNLFAVFSGPGDAEQPPADDPPATPAPGSISGRVWQTDIMDGTLEGITVYMVTAAGSLTGRLAQTSADGSFAIPELAPGTYKLYFLDPSGVYQPGWYGGPDVPDGAVVRVASGGAVFVTQQMRAAVAEGYGTIRGRVTDQSDTGVAGVDVYAYAVETGSDQLLDLRGHSVTDELGYYTLQKLPPGDGGKEPGAILGYKIQFAPPAAGGMAPQWYQGQGTHATAKIVSLKFAEEVTGVDAVLDGGGTISGSVKGAHTDSLPWMLVDFYDESGIIVDSLLTDAQGGFVSHTLAPGKYRIHVTGGNGFLGEWYNDKKDSGGADYVTVLRGHDSSGIDIQLKNALEESHPVPAPAAPLPEAAARQTPLTPGGEVDPEAGAPGESGSEPGSGDSADQAAPDQLPDGVLPPDEHEEQFPGQRGHDQVPDGQAEADDPGHAGMQLSGQNLQ